MRWQVVPIPASRPSASGTPHLHTVQVASGLTCRRRAPRRRCASPCDSAARASCHPRRHRRSYTRAGPHSPRCVRRGRGPAAPAPPPDPRSAYRSSRRRHKIQSFRIQQLAPAGANLWERRVLLCYAQCGSQNGFPAHIHLDIHLQLGWLRVASSWLYRFAADSRILSVKCRTCSVFI